MEVFSIEFEDVDTDSKVFGVYSGHVTLPDKYVCTAGDKPFSRFFYIVNGSISLETIGYDKVIGEKGDIIFLPTDITYASEWLPPSNGDYISINFNLADNSIRFPSQICIVGNDTDGIYLKVFKEMLSSWMTGAFGYKFKMLSELYKLLYMLYLNSAKKQIQDNYNEIHKAILYIENHYLEDIDVNALARGCHMGTTQFHKLFKEYKNMPPITYRNYLRIKKAYEMLSLGEYNVSETARAVNIPDVSYFNKLFKKYFNVTPGSIAQI